MQLRLGAVLACVLILSGSVGHAQEPDNALVAKDAAMSFVEAFNKRSTDAMLKVAAIPFLAGEEVNKNMIPFARVARTNQELNLALTTKIEGKLPGAVVRVEKYPAPVQAFAGTATPEKKFLDELLAKDGYIVYFGAKKVGNLSRPSQPGRSADPLGLEVNAEYPVYVLVREKQAKVVGWWRTQVSPSESVNRQGRAFSVPSAGPASLASWCFPSGCGAQSIVN